MSTTNSLNINNSGLPIFNSVTGQFAAVSLTAKGDLLVHNGTNYTNMAVGANGLVLSANSAQATGLQWVSLPFTGSMILLSTADVSNAANVSFTGLDVSTYATLFFFLDQVQPVTDNVILRCLFSIDNGVSYLASNYRYIYRILDTGTGAATESHSSSSSNIDSANAIGNSAGEGIAGWFWYSPSNDASQMRQSIIWQLYGQDTTTDLNGYYGSGTNSTTSQVDAIQFKFSSGNIASGKFYLYGIKAS